MTFNAPVGSLSAVALYVSMFCLEIVTATWLFIVVHSFVMELQQFFSFGISPFGSLSLPAQSMYRSQFIVSLYTSSGFVHSFVKAFVGSLSIYSFCSL